MKNLNTHLHNLNTKAAELNAELLETVGNGDITALLERQERLTGEIKATAAALELETAKANAEAERVKSKEYKVAKTTAERLTAELESDIEAIERQAVELVKTIEAWEKKAAEFRKLNRKHTLNLRDPHAAETVNLYGIPALLRTVKAWHDNRRKWSK